MRISGISLAMLVVLVGCGGGSNAPGAVDAPPVTNDNGQPTTGVLTAVFAPSDGVVPLPNNLLFLGTGDLTLNLPIADPTDPAAGPLLAINALDGWGTTTPWQASFSSSIDASTVLPGQTVRLFEVALAQPAGPVVAVIEELTPGVDFVTTVSTTNPLEQSIVIVPIRPLKEITTYMAVITRGVTDLVGNNATPDQQYFLAQRTDPLIDDTGASTDPLLTDSLAQALEPLRQLTNAQEAALASVGIPSDDVVVSWVATTQSITPVLNAVRGTINPQPSQFAFSGLTTAALGLNGIADIYIGVMSVPYYLDTPTATNPTAILGGSWEASPGAYVPPFDTLGLDPTSTNVTFLNPIPVVKSTQTIPVLATLPNAASGMSRPPAGWPVVIYQHGITRDRTDALAVAEAMAATGFAVISIDQPLHGIVPNGGPLDALYVENTPFGPLADERTFDADFADNATGAQGPDGLIDASGTYFINLTSLLTSRDNNRQAQADLSVLAVSLGNMDLDGDGQSDLDDSQVRFVGQSLGAINGIPFLAVEGARFDSAVQTGVLSVPGGGIVGLLLGSPAFGPSILAGLAQSGIEPGTEDFDTFVLAAQTVTDSSDPINWAALAAAVQPVLIQEVVGSAFSPPDQVIPNSVPGFPLSGTEPLIAAMGLNPITQTTQNPDGIRGVTRFLVGGHGSILSPDPSPEATLEMQTQAASMVGSNGTAVQVVVPEILAGN
ncbi:MAG: lipase [Pseudomonadota bacterium]